MNAFYAGYVLLMSAARLSQMSHKVLSFDVEKAYVKKLCPEAVLIWRSTLSKSVTKNTYAPGLKLLTSAADAANRARHDGAALYAAE
ncbi:hypothetical protein [Agrobacterium tumefaciens]|uniref:hypothetical protein n=1 Tax=Agrobacterium tumefaciens TaxID=358 RepID=UPI000CF1B5BD|nr:hypothetical protein [Agrobacterium tumefaciens]NSY98958.1 hypothetical protein [Agrobacterium tumefaciens]